MSVVIATYKRPEVLRSCLEHLELQTATPREILVVDASPDDESRSVVATFSSARYTRNDEGMGTLPRSRQIGVAETDGDVVAFLDDDAFADPNWLAELAGSYGAGIGGVGGQARNGQPGEEVEGSDQIGRFFTDGSLTGFFAADPGEEIEVDHLIGCNMSFRRAALEDSGGIPAWPAGVSALREDLYVSLRVRDAGWRLVFNPRAGVRHIGAPQAKGRRFDLRYDFNGNRNHMFVLVAHFGPRSPVPWRFCRTLVVGRSRALVGAASRLLAVPVSIGIGTAKGLAYRKSRRSRHQ
ncbi:MAG: glycosyltransferase [Acidimicrobiales bacterium]|nr:glycosyltransferase [Acidimicrobiales bacterium]